MAGDQNKNSKKKGNKEKSGKKVKSQKSDWNDDKNKGPTRNVNILDESAMYNALNICHNVQDLLYYRGFYWEGQNKKGKSKTRKKKGGAKK